VRDAGLLRRGPDLTGKPLGRRCVRIRIRAVRVTNPEDVRTFLDDDPVANAFPWFRIFHAGDAAYVDGRPPRAVLSVGRLPVPAPFRFCARHATDRSAAESVLEAMPSGPAFLFLTEPWQLDLVKARAAVNDTRPSWLFRWDAEDFVDAQEHDVGAVGPEWAGLIAKWWEPENPVEPYVRSRLEHGLSRGIYDGDRLVAWYATHVETDKVAIMGFLHVLDEYRRKGYARSLSCALAREIFHHGKTPVCHVYLDNEPSIRLMESLGLRRVKQQVFTGADIR